MFSNIFYKKIIYIYIVFLLYIYVCKIEIRTISQGMLPDGSSGGTGHGGWGTARSGHGWLFSGRTYLKPVFICPGKTLKGVCLRSAPEHGPSATSSSRGLQAAPLRLPLSHSPTGQPRGSPGRGFSPIKKKSLKSLSVFPLLLLYLAAFPGEKSPGLVSPSSAGSLAPPPRSLRPRWAGAKAP